MSPDERRLLILAELCLGGISYEVVSPDTGEVEDIDLIDLIRQAIDEPSEDEEDPGA